MENLIDDIRYAISRIEKSYYYTLHDFNDAPACLSLSEEQRKIIIESLPTYCERLFAYELYFYLRLIIEGKGDKCKDLRLTGELRKEKLKVATTDLLGIEPLSQTFIPDFLIHNPNNAELQLAVIELKASPFINAKNISYDLKKIYEFIKSYNYKQGFFIAVNTEPYKVFTTIRQLGIFTDEWPLNNIQIIIKENYESEIISQSVANILGL